MSNLGLGVDWQSGVQEGLIYERGSDMLHEIGMACPSCRTEDVYAGLTDDGKQRRRSPTCEVCSRDDWIFRNPLVVKGLATSIRQQKNVLDAGLTQPGDMLFSPLPFNADGCTGSEGIRRIGQNDKITALWSQPLDDGQTVIRGAGTQGENIGLKTKLTKDEDRLWYEPDESLWCEDEKGKTYSQNADFILGPGKVINWVGTRPKNGTSYVLKYSAFYEWIVWQPPQERRDRDNRDLGPLIFLRRRHIAFVNSSPKVVDSDRISLQSRVSC